MQNPSVRAEVGWYDLKYLFYVRNKSIEQIPNIWVICEVFKNRENENSFCIELFELGVF